MNLTPLDYQILAVLALMPDGGELYGVPLRARVMRFRSFWRPSVGALYTSLHKMEERGLVSARWGEFIPERVGRRRWYRVTEAARDVLNS